MVLTHAHRERRGDCTLDDRLLAEVCVALIYIN